MSLLLRKGSPARISVVRYLTPFMSSIHHRLFISHIAMSHPNATNTAVADGTADHRARQLADVGIVEVRFSRFFSLVSRLTHRRRLSAEDGSEHFHADRIEDVSSYSFFGTPTLSNYMLL